MSRCKFWVLFVALVSLLVTQGAWAAEDSEDNVSRPVPVGNKVRGTYIMQRTVKAIQDGAANAWMFGGGGGARWEGEYTDVFSGNEMLERKFKNVEEENGSYNFAGREQKKKKPFYENQTIVLNNWKYDAPAVEETTEEEDDVAAGGGIRIALGGGGAGVDSRYCLDRVMQNSGHMILAKLLPMVPEVGETIVIKDKDMEALLFALNPLLKERELAEDSLKITAECAKTEDGTRLLKIHAEYRTDLDDEAEVEKPSFATYEFEFTGSGRFMMGFSFKYAGAAPYEANGAGGVAIRVVGGGGGAAMENPAYQHEMVSGKVVYQDLR